MSARILVVEDEPAIAESIAYNLIAGGLTVQTVGDGRSAHRRHHEGFDLVVLDLGLPDVSGLEVCRRIRAESAVPILILTARTSETDRVLGLEIGADDYLGKPFSMPELLSRIRALLRRRELDRRELDGRVTDRVLQSGDLHLDLVEHTATVDGHSVHLTPTEFRLLTMLAEQAGRPVGRRQIATQLSRGGVIVDQRTCSSHVKNLRLKIEADPAHPRRLLTVRGVGYLLQDPSTDHTG